MTIHRAQGQTLQKAHIVDDKFFAPYQFYTALSRVKSLKDVTFEFPITREQLQTSPEVIEFYNNLKTIELNKIDFSKIKPIEPEEDPFITLLNKLSSESKS